MSVSAVAAHAGNGGVVTSTGVEGVTVDGENVAAGEARAELAGADAGGADPPAHGCGARAHVGGNNDAMSAAEPGLRS